MTGALALAVAICVSGCSFVWGEEYDPAPAPGWVDNPGYDGDLTVQNVWIEGDMGYVNGVYGDIYDVQASSYGTAGTVRIDSYGVAGWVMVVVDLPDIGNLYPGQRIQTSMLGCSGPQPNDWDYDQHASSVEVVVSEGSTYGYVRIDFVAEFVHDGRPQVVSGSFELLVP